MTYTLIVLAALIVCTIAEVPSSPFQENVHPFFLPKALINARLYNAQVKDHPTGSHLTNRARNYANIECEPKHAQRCQARYADNLHASLEMFQSPEEFTKVVTRYYNTTLENGLLPFCAYRAEYFTCLGDMYEPCTDVFQIAKQVSNLGDAFGVGFMYKTVAFDCLGGNVQLTANYDCFLDNMKNVDHQATEQSCFDTFSNTLHGNMDNFCSNAQILLNCTASVYLNNTCPGNELAWWNCEHYRVGFDMDGFCPDLDCNVVINPPANVPAPVSDTGSDGTSGSAVASFGSHSQGLNDYGLSPEWERRMIGGGAFVSDARLHLYKELSRHHMKNMQGLVNNLKKLSDL